MTATLFISDLHLSSGDPDSLKRFQRFIARTALKAQALYILGDLFEAWVGDDDLAEPTNKAVLQSLRRLSDAGIPVHIMHGNRDFLLGQDFMAACGAHLITEPCLIDLHGSPTLLMHGDSYCIDDQPYQEFRRKVRTPAWQADFLARPLAERKAIAQGLRQDSRESQSGKTLAILDVNPDAVAQSLRDMGYPRLIHGHTHRPAHHVFIVDGIECERWVLPDWYTDGGYLACGPSGCALYALSEAPHSTAQAH